MMEHRAGENSPDTEWGAAGPSINLAHILGCMSSPLVLLDQDGRIQYISPSAEELTGRRAKECIGTVLDDLMPRGADACKASLHQAIGRCVSGCPEGTVITLSTPTGNMDVRCSLVPTTGDQGLVDGALLIVNDRGASPARTAEGLDLSQSVQVLARTSADIIENADLKEIIEGEVARLVSSLGLDFAVFRIISPDDRPLMLCHGIEYKEARELLESRLADGTPLYLSVCQGKDALIGDLRESNALACPLPDVTALACLPIHWSNKAYGCAVFGTKASSTNILPYYPVLQVFCNQVGTSLRNATLYRELKLRNTELRGVSDTFRVLSSTLELQEVLDIILHTARDLVGAENCFIFELNPVRGKLRLVSKISREGITDEIELDVGEGITGHVAKTGKGMLVERADLDPRSAQVPGTPEEEPSSIISVPLKFSDELLGVMTLEKTPGVPFDRSQYELMETFSLQAAMALHNASLYETIKGYVSNLQTYNVLLTHDVANFNVPIHGFLEMLLKDPKLDERQRRYVRSALVQSDNISELISDARELSRLRSKLGEKPLEPVDMVPVIAEAKEDIFSNPVYEDIETRLVSSVESAYTMADGFLKDLFYNLMSNACKYGNGRPVEIDISEHEDAGKNYWMIRITDQGKGIPDERKANLFKRFDQLDTQQGSDGHGLGLSLVGALCERYGGAVRVEDRVYGDQTKGSRFIVLLPVSARGQEAGGA